MSGLRRGGVCSNFIASYGGVARFPTVVIRGSIWIWCPIHDVNLSLLLAPVTRLNEVILLLSREISRLDPSFKIHKKRLFPLEFASSKLDLIKALNVSPLYPNSIILQMVYLCFLLSIGLSFYFWTTYICIANFIFKHFLKMHVFMTDIFYMFDSIVWRPWISHLFFSFFA